jgi:hypothetical protein
MTIAPRTAAVMTMIRRIGGEPHITRFDRIRMLDRIGTFDAVRTFTQSLV